MTYMLTTHPTTLAQLLRRILAWLLMLFGHRVGVDTRRLANSCLNWRRRNYTVTLLKVVVVIATIVIVARAPFDCEATDATNSGRQNKWLIEN